MKTKVITIADDCSDRDWVKGEIGYIDGYCRAADDRAYAMVVVGKNIKMITLRALEVIEPSSVLEVKGE